MRRFVVLMVVTLLAGCSNCPDSGEPPMGDPATWKRYSAEQLARMHFKSRIPDVRIEFDSANFTGRPEEMNLFYTANDLDKERWWRVEIRAGQVTMFSERTGWIGRLSRDKAGLRPD